MAPTIPVMAKDAVMDSWQDVTLTAGRIFGKEDKAQSLVDDVNPKSPTSRRVILQHRARRSRSDS